MSRIYNSRMPSVLLAGLALAACVVLLLVALGQPARATFPGENGKIAYTAWDGNDFEIYSRNPDGTELDQLTNNTVDDVDRNWSPDGTKIAYAISSSGNYSLHIMPATGGTPTLQLGGSGIKRGPAWSPDGTKIAYEVLAASGYFDVSVVSATGGHLLT